MLKNKRVDAGRTQEEIAELLEISLELYAEIESNPDEASYKILSKISKILDTSVDDILMNEDECVIEVGSPYIKIFDSVTFLNSYIEDHSNPFSSKGELQAEKAINTINMVACKPNLGVMGRSDSGKSHFINELINNNCLPAKLQPTTSAITILRHINDRPNGIKDTVLIFKEMVALNNLDSLDYCSNKENVYISGDYNILSSEIVHDHENGRVTEAYSCVVYIKADILNSCNIIDAPGFSNTDSDKGDYSDAAKAISILSMLDILIYMSPVTGCMDNTDLLSLRNIFKTLPELADTNKSLPVLSNIFFVTTHAAPHIPDGKLKDLCNTAANRIHRNFYIEKGKGILEERGNNCGQEITAETLKNRWYFFWSSTKERREPLFNDISELLNSQMPAIIKKNIYSVISDVKKNSVKSIENEISIAMDKLIKYTDLLRSYEKQLAPEEITRKLDEIEKLKIILIRLLTETKQNSIEKINKSIASETNVKHIEKIISSKFKDNKKEAEQYAYSHIIERMQTNIEDTFSKETKSLEKEMSQHLDCSSKSFNKIESSEIEVNTPFDIKGAFLGGGAGAGLAAGLGIYASTMGTLGGYAVAAQGVGILSSLGIGFGATAGTSGVMSGIAALGGPITITLLAAAAVAWLGFSLFGDSWEKRLAEEILVNIDKNNIEKTLVDNVSSQLTNFNQLIDYGCSNLKDCYIELLKKMEDELKNPSKSKQELGLHIDMLREDLSFFVEAPWVHA